MMGDKAAAARVTGIEIPFGNATADPLTQYNGFYNPGGPGNNPAPGVNYTVAGPYQLQSVVDALDDPMTVTFNNATAPPTPAPAAAPAAAPVAAPETAPEAVPETVPEAAPEAAPGASAAFQAARPAAAAILGAVAAVFILA